MITLRVVSIIVMIFGFIAAVASGTQIEPEGYMAIADPFASITMAIYWVMFSLGLMGLGLAIGLQEFRPAKK